MMVATAPIPMDEAARITELHGYRILDTPPDERFDLFSRLCLWLFDVPIAAINLIDADRTFFKSLIGFDVYEPRRATSICAHAVAGCSDIMVVDDMAKDERFFDHPLTLAGVRFYAGAILRGASGHALGTLCICDKHPRSLAGAERQRLTELSKGVESVLELHRNSLILLQAAMQDALTGLGNRVLLMERLKQAVARAERGQACSVLYVDLDRFKLVNDTFGHAGGDALLQEVASRLASVARGEDVVARLSGDEFAVLLCPPATPEQAEAVARRILDNFSQPYFLAGSEVPIACSIGIACCPLHATDSEGLIRSADVAMYEAKRLGRNRYQMARARGVAASALVAS